VPQPSKKARFITLEGGEGTGKSTQIRFLMQRLEAHGVTAKRTREPGGSDGAERIRSLILESGQKRFDALTETLLFFAARNDHLEHIIRPSLEAGTWIVCDRFADSTRVYQGCMGTIDFETLNRLEALVIASTTPDLTLILDLPAEIGIARANARRGAIAADGFEAESLDFHQGLRQCYLELAKRDPERCVIVEAEGEAEEVARKIWQIVSKRFFGDTGAPLNG
jgi:dTMP kinase